jgi:F-type H+-transporting ATPase subunit epsilon
VALSEDVEMVTLPGVEGELGIYPQHVPLMTQIVPGLVIAKKGTQEFALAVGEGLVEITGDRVSLLTGLAISADADAAEAEAARKRAEVRRGERLGSEQSAVVEAAVTHSLAQLKVKRRQR